MMDDIMGYFPSSKLEMKIGPKTKRHLSTETDYVDKPAIYPGDTERWVFVYSTKLIEQLGAPTFLAKGFADQMKNGKVDKDGKIQYKEDDSVELRLMMDNGGHVFGVLEWTPLPWKGLR